jgi:flagellar M-ring protein FliF
VKALSVAVLIDGTYREESGRRVFVPRTDEELEKMKALVASAVGISEARGDRIELTSAPFQAPEVEAGAGVLGRATEWLPAVLGRLLGVGLVLGVLAIVVRPIVQALGGPGTHGRVQRPGLLFDRDTAVSELAHENVSLAQQNPERAAQLVRQWLLDDSQRTA